MHTGSRVRFVVVTISELIELEVAVFTVRVASDRLQSTEEQGLTHHTEVLAQGVHDLDTSVKRQLGQRLVVRDFGKRVIEYLAEALCSQLLRDAAAQFLGIGFDTIRQASIQFFRELDIVVTVDSEDVFHYVALALYVHAVTRHFQLPGIAKLGDYVDFQGFKNGLDGIFSDCFTDEGVDTVDVDSDRPRFE